MLYASLCINDPFACMKLRMFCRKHQIRKQTFPLVAPDRSKSTLMMLHPTHVCDNDVFIDHTHWRSENEKVARMMLLMLNVRSPSLLKHPSEVRY